MSIVETNYFRVDLEYLQRSSMLVAAKDAEAAKAMVLANIEEGVEGFKINEVAELSDEEKENVIKYLSGVPEDATEVPSHVNPKDLN